MNSISNMSVKLGQIRGADGDLLNTRHQLKSTKFSLSADLWTPLTLSVKMEQFVVAAMLVESGADVNLTTGAGYSAIWLLAAKPPSPESSLLGELLLEKGADSCTVPSITIDGPFGENALHMAVRRRNLPLIRAILERNPEANVPNTAGDLPVDLFVSPSEGHVSTNDSAEIRRLLQLPD